MGRKLDVLRGVDMEIQRRRDGRHRRPLRRRQVHAPALHRHARRADGGDDRPGGRGPDAPARVAARRPAQPHASASSSSSTTCCPSSTPLENVMMPGLVQGKSKRELEARARALLEEVGLKEPRSRTGRASSPAASSSASPSRARSSSSRSSCSPTSRPATSTPRRARRSTTSSSRSTSSAARPSSSSRTTRPSPSACRASSPCATAASKRTSGASVGLPHVDEGQERSRGSVRRPRRRGRTEPDCPRSTSATHHRRRASGALRTDR